MKIPKKKEEQAHLPHELAGARLPRYRRLRRNILTISSIVALAPLFILTAINYLQDRESYRIESNFAISQILSNTKRTLEFVVDERRSALAMIIRQHSYEEFASDSALANTLQNLKNSFGGFVDLGLIDSAGRQAYYSGPYDLKNREYKDQGWFHEVVLRGSHVSDVFMGYRNFPHFVIAFKHEKEPGNFYIIRATLDMNLINQMMYSANMDLNTDVFIINQTGVLQTESVFYGAVLQTADIQVPAGPRKREVISETDTKQGHVNFGYAYIEGTPFILMVIKRMEHPFQHWLNHRSYVLWFLLVSAAGIFVVIFYGANSMTRQLREADLRRVKAFHNIEYTSKMATIGRMAAGVAHEINNPMAIINEKAGLIKDMVSFSEGYPQKEKLLGLVESILRSVQRCSQVTHRLLGFAKRMEVRQEPIDLKELLTEVAGFQNTDIVHRNIILNFSFQENLPRIESDRGQLQQVFLNIINNAIAAVDDGGRIDVSASASDNNSVSVSIADNGSGISEENLKHVFEPFFSTKGEFGTGLGLSITRDIVEKLGGEIGVQSELGKGTRFLVTLPLRKSSLGE
jgi:two-component system NtrC family sensor kinase